MTRAPAQRQVAELVRNDEDPGPCGCLYDPSRRPL